MRTRVRQLATTKWREALEVAAGIPLPWYRVQAIASVAAKAPDDRVDSILIKARDAAGLDTDAYPRTAVLAWVVEAAVARDRLALAREMLAEALKCTATITPARSRASALELLLAQAVVIGEREAENVAGSLLDVAEQLSADPVRRWRNWGRSYINRTAWSLSGRHPHLALRLLTARFGASHAAAVISRHAASSEG